MTSNELVRIADRLPPTGEYVLVFCPGGKHAHKGWYIASYEADVRDAMMSRVEDCDPSGGAFVSTESYPYDGAIIFPSTAASHWCELPPNPEEAK